MTPARGARGIYRGWKLYLKRVHAARRHGEVCPECGHLVHPAWRCNGGTAAEPWPRDGRRCSCNCSYPDDDDA